MKTRGEKSNFQFNLLLNFQLIPRILSKMNQKQFFDENKSISIKWFNLGIYFWKLVTIIFASVFKLSVHCTYSIGYRKCSPFFFFFMAFSWPFFLSFYTQDIACRHSLGELSLKKKKISMHFTFSLFLGSFFYSFSYILVSFCFLIHLLEIDCQCWLALQHHGPVSRALRLVKGKAIETGIILSILDIKNNFYVFWKKVPD